MLIDCVCTLFQTTRNAVLSRYAEHRDMRIKTFQNATAVYDLLAITLVRRAQFDMLSEVCVVMGAGIVWGWEGVEWWYDVEMVVSNVDGWTLCCMVV